MHKEIHSIRKTNKKKSLHRGTYIFYLRTHCFIMLCNASFLTYQQNKSVQMKQKGKIKKIHKQHEVTKRGNSSTMC